MLAPDIGSASKTAGGTPRLVRVPASPPMPLGPVDLHRLRLVQTTAARMGRYLGEPADYQ